MSDYTPITDFSAKDALTTADPEKIILGSDVDAEFDAINVAVATKYDSADLASQAQAEAESSNTVLMTPGRVANWSDYNAGIVGDLQAKTDPNADQILGWDDSAGAAIGFTLVAPLAFDTTTIKITDAAGIVTDLAALTDPGADRVFGWDESADAAIGFALSTGLTTSTTNILIDTTVVPLLASSNTFANNQNFFGDGAHNEYSTTPNLGLSNDGAAILTIRDSTNNVESFLVSGTASLQIGTYTAHPVDLYVGNSLIARIETTGQLTNMTNLVDAFGYRGLPTGTDETPVAADSGKMILASSNVTVTDDNHAVGTVLTIVNNSASAITISTNEGTLRWAGTGGTDGTRTLASHQGIATMVKLAADFWVISGNLT